MAITLTPTAATGSEFTGWSGACSGTGACQVTMSEARSVTAGFAVEEGTPPPSEFQLTTTYVAAVGAGTPHCDAAAGLIKLITAPAAAPVLRAKGLDPAG